MIIRAIYRRLWLHSGIRLPTVCGALSLDEVPASGPGVVHAQLPATDRADHPMLSPAISSCCAKSADSNKVCSNPTRNYWHSCCSHPKLPTDLLLGCHRLHDLLVLPSLTAASSAQPMQLLRYA